MSMKFHVLLFAIAILFLFPLSGYSQCSTEGKEFYIVFMSNYDGKGVLKLYITSRVGNDTAIITYDTKTLKYAVVKDQITSVILPTDTCMIQTYKTIESKSGVYVRSQGGTTMSVYGINREDASTDAFAAIPLDGLGKYYRVMSYPTVDRSECAIVATEDSTEVEFRLPTVSPNPLKIMLQRQQTYQVKTGVSDGDITGGTITSTKPIAVFSGSNCADVPNGVPYCDQLCDQLMPANSWGQLFYTLPYATRKGDVVRVLAEYDSTQVYINGTPAGLPLAAGKFYETEVDTPIEIYATKPVEVAQFCEGATTAGGGAIGDPFMIIIPQEDMFLDEAIVATPDSFQVNFINIVAPLSYITNVKLDGAAVNGWVSIPNVHGIRQYAATSVTIAEGTHKLNYDPIPAPIQDRNTICGYVYGYGLYDSYGYTGAFGTKPTPRIASDPYRDSIDCSVTQHDSILVINNECQGLLRIDSITLTGDPSFTIQSALSFPIYVGSRGCDTIKIRYAPTGAGTQTATLTAWNNDKITPALSIPLLGHKDFVSITRAPMAIDFGTVGCAGMIDTVISLTNTGTQSFQITDTAFTANNKTFTILSPALPFTIKSGEQVKLRLRFDPSTVSSGAYTSTMTLSGKPCGIATTVSFTTNRVVFSYGIAPNNVDLGVVAIDSSASGTVQFENNNSFKVRVRGAHFENANFTGVVQTSFPVTLGANAKLAVNFSAKPTSEEDFSGDLCIEVDSACFDKRCVPVTISGTALVTVPDASALNNRFPGEIADVPFILLNTLKVTKADSIIIFIHYDQDILRIIGDITTSFGTIENYSLDQASGTISFVLHTNKKLDTPAAVIAWTRMEALLAPRLTGSVDVKISTVRQANRTIPSSVRSSPFTLNATCINPNTLRSRGSAELLTIYPNPATDNTAITIRVSEKTTDCFVDLIDLFGKTQIVLYDGPLVVGTHEFTINTKKIPSSVYLVRLRTGNEVIVKRVVVN